mgnify:FL=1
MNSFNIIYKQYGKYSAIIYPVSYLNPIEDIQLISVELKKHLTAGCYVLFDLLLSNGDNFNRFAEVYYDGNDIQTSAVSITEIPSGEVRGLNMYYRGKTKELSKSVLSAKERFRFATMK